MTADFKALDIGYEVQKSFANKFFSNKNVAKGLIDNTSAALLDELYKLIKIYVSTYLQIKFSKPYGVIMIKFPSFRPLQQTSSKKDAEKIVKNIIKISVKIGMLERSDKFSAQEKASLVRTQRNLRTIAMTLISFYQVDHTYDRSFLTRHVAELKDDLKELVRPHLTEKSLARIDFVLDFFSQVQNS